ncbi:hypothetical protein BDZ45DRAFT_751956 [Acephala macrosclerotiorum]|nr:hypothetical protein BDZ45DRAFT_751956 [Acephala macrosclerotiorum]
MSTGRRNRRGGETARNLPRVGARKRTSPMGSKEIWVSAWAGGNVSLQIRMVQRRKILHGWCDKIELTKAPAHQPEQPISLSSYLSGQDWDSAYNPRRLCSIALTQRTEIFHIWRTAESVLYQHPPSISPTLLHDESTSQLGRSRSQHIMLQP